MKRIHLIGICGTAMATLAALLKSRGYDVRGSDQNVYPPMSDFLAEQQITTLQGYDFPALMARNRAGLCNNACHMPQFLHDGSQFRCARAALWRAR